MEEWKAIPGYEGYYEASTLGRIRSVERFAMGRCGLHRVASHILKTNNVHHGYLQVKFSINGVKSQPSVHRLIAMTFVPNPDNFPQVNHKDGNAGNNAVENLEWCTASQNCWHRNNVLNKYVGRPKRPVRCIETGEEFESTYHAAREMKCNQSCVYSVCSGKQSHAHGYHFEFI